jgi:hypothetical protein
MFSEIGLRSFTYALSTYRLIYKLLLSQEISPSSFGGLHHAVSEYQYRHPQIRISSRR